MMQALNVKQVSKTQRVNKTFHQALIKPSEKLDVKVEKVTETTKAPSFNRFLEAYGDCV
jgi:hypothetical protein